MTRHFGRAPFDDILADLRRTGPFPVRHPLWERLWEAAGETVGTPPSVRVDFDPIGLNLDAPPLKCGSYDCSPLNTVQFAWTGGDGDHFSMVPVNGVVGPDSPVVLTIPTAFDETGNTIVAGSLDDFLRVGLHYGFFQYLENFAEEYAGRTDWWFGEELEDEQIELLRRLADQLDLEPLPPATVDRRSLDKTVRGLLQFRCDLNSLE